eukprot:g259.t1
MSYARVLSICCGIIAAFAKGETCLTGTKEPDDGWVSFWMPSDPPTSPSKKWNQSEIPHRETPYDTAGGFAMDAGILGQNQWARKEVIRSMDASAAAYEKGTVDATYGYPLTTSGGFERSADDFYDNFFEGLKSEHFVVLDQKKSTTDNVDIVGEDVDGHRRNVLRLKATGSFDDDGEWTFESGALIQTANFYSSGRFSIRAKVPAVLGIVFSMWTFHYEEHYASFASNDTQFVKGATGDSITRVNHEIDWEIPASGCKTFCAADTCVGQFNTSNLNTYIFENNAGMANLCVKSPDGVAFIDNEWHEYAFEWHSGYPNATNEEDACTPKVNFFFDDAYIGTNDVFVPTRGSRLVFGVWGGNKNWVGLGNWTEIEVLVSDVSVCPFDEGFDSMYPQNYDQPTTTKKIWTPVDIPPVVQDQDPPEKRCAKSPCDEESGRPDGCACEKSWECASDWCEDEACGGVVTGE